MFVKSLVSVAAGFSKDERGDDVAELFLEFGLQLLNEGRRNEAVEVLNYVTQMAKSEQTRRAYASVAYYKLGTIFRTCHAYNEAQVCFDRASKLNESYFEATFNNSLCLLTMGEVDAAISVLASCPSADNPDSESQRRMLAALNYSDSIPRDEVPYFSQKAHVLHQYSNDCPQVSSRHEQWASDTRAAVGAHRTHPRPGADEVDRPLRVG